MPPTQTSSRGKVTSRRFRLSAWLISLASLVGVATSFPVAHHTRRSTGLSQKNNHKPATDGCRRRVLSLLARSDDNEFVFQRKQQQKDIVIVGGALAGLSAALYLTQMDPSRHVTILDREEYGNPTRKKPKHAQSSSFAAAGMLAPLSERLSPGPLFDLCMSSRRMYTGFCDMVETLAQESGEEGARYLFDSEFPHAPDVDDMDPWSVGYVGSGGFLAPAFAGDTVATWAPPEDGGAVWLDATQVRELEPRLHQDVAGGWWFPDDASVDARRLTCSLRAACIAAGVQILSGPHNEVVSLDLEDGTCRGVFLKRNKGSGGQRLIRANQVLIANGAWMRDLLPVPIEPHKGQSLSLRMPEGSTSFLRRVLFAQDSYIVPKADGRIVVGATVEAGSFDPNVTPLGLMHILTHAMELVPELKDLTVEETWVGLRPTTPDKGPIIGKTLWNNVFVAGGYWRNGVLLSPKTGQLVASLMLSCTDSDKFQLTEDDAAMLTSFSWDRFTAPEKSAALTANARFASAAHPIQKRGRASISSGTELGSYSTARTARDERRMERDSLLNDNNTDDAFERAAALGRKDIVGYQLDNNVVNGEVTPEAYDLEGAADALTIGIADNMEDNESQENEDSEPSLDLQTAYDKIQQNQLKREVTLSNDEEEPDEQPDPGFRIMHVDSKSGEMREVPPYTSPQDFLNMIEKEKNGQKESSVEAPPETLTEHAPESAPESNSNNAAADSAFDGYQDIQGANSRSSREDELEAMRAARVKNRMGHDKIDHSKIGGYGIDGKD